MLQTEMRPLMRLLPLVLTFLLMSATHARSGDAPARVIELDRIIEAPRAEVWKAFTTVEGVTSFFSPRAKVELRMGGAYELHFAPDAPEGTRGSEGCRVLSFVEGEMLSFTWNAPPNLPEARWRRTFVVLRFDDAEEGKTRLRITHGGWDASEGEQWDRAFAYFSQVWGFVVDHLDRRFSDGPFMRAGSGEFEGPEPRPFVYFIHPAREGMIETMTDEERSIINEHAAYVRSLLASGVLMLAGPSLDPAWTPRGENAVALEIPAPGIVVFTAPNEAAAREIMENDPAVRAGVFKAQLNEFRASFIGL
ncbi:MAG: hypothetical protein EA376_07020 [Phycisphaeraceae bacterium]|nr:MAG: hypothetical protein EA376_07020 [Phycisphaeraceae bacterium]